MTDKLKVISARTLIECKTSASPRAMEALYHLAVDFVQDFELVFDNDWDFTQETISQNQPEFISESGTFINPKVRDIGNNWFNRGSLLQSYRRIRALLNTL